MPSLVAAEHVMLVVENKQQTPQELVCSSANQACEILTNPDLTVSLQMLIWITLFPIIFGKQENSI